MAKTDENKFYDGTKLLSMKDIDGNTPEIYISTSNRCGGKTTYFNRLAVNRFKKNGCKFGLIYRYKNELDDVADKFFKDIHGLFFKNDEFTSVKRADGVYHELYLNGESCGYALALNSADKIKKMSHFFSDIGMMIFDEFQSESNDYCSNEVQKFISIHTSLARGQGQQSRYLPVYMISNPVTLLNPYYVELGISERLQKETKFLKGKGFVVEQGYNEAASLSVKQSGFMQAFAKNEYVEYAGQAVYLNDNETFIEKMKGRNQYIATIAYNGNNFAIREYIDEGIVYCDDRPDMTHPLKISLTTNDHDVNYVMLRHNDTLFSILRYYFNHGAFRFKNLKCKECIFKALTYK
jgi:hypothetical protein